MHTCKCLFLCVYMCQYIHTHLHFGISIKKYNLTVGVSTIHCIHTHIQTLICLHTYTHGVTDLYVCMHKCTPSRMKDALRNAMPGKPKERRSWLESFHHIFSIWADLFLSNCNNLVSSQQGIFPTSVALNRFLFCYHFSAWFDVFQCFPPYSCAKYTLNNLHIKVNADAKMVYNLMC